MLVETVALSTAQVQRDLFHTFPPWMPHIVIHFGDYRRFRIIDFFFFFFFLLFHRHYLFSRLSRLFHRLSGLSRLFHRLSFFLHRLNSLYFFALFFHTL